MPDQMTLEQFGAKIKSKYPEYASYSDTDIANKVIAKYPQYKSQIGPASVEGTANAPETPRLEGPIHQHVSSDVGRRTQASHRHAREHLLEAPPWAHRTLCADSAAGAAGLILHPISSLYGSAQLAADALNQMFPDSGLNPQQKAAKRSIPRKTEIAVGSDQGKPRLRDGKHHRRNRSGESAWRSGRASNKGTQGYSSESAGRRAYLSAVTCRCWYTLCQGRSAEGRRSGERCRYCPSRKDAGISARK